jgi:hypothetical protein
MATLLSPSPASRPAPAGYKVDISRGERIGRVSSEWFSRPDDERFLSLTELHAAVKTRAERATTRTVETREVRVEAKLKPLRTAITEVVSFLESEEGRAYAKAQDDEDPMDPEDLAFWEWHLSLP